MRRLVLAPLLLLAACSSDIVLTPDTPSQQITHFTPDTRFVFAAGLTQGDVAYRTHDDGLLLVLPSGAEVVIIGAADLRVDDADRLLPGFPPDPQTTNDP